MIDPSCSVVVTVIVVIDGETEVCTVVVTSDPRPLPSASLVAAEPPPAVTVFVAVAVAVAWVARLLPTSSAFCIAELGMGVPANSHASCRGVKRMLLSRLLSQFPCMQVMRSGRKFPADALHKHFISETEQLSSPLWSMHCCTQSGRDWTS